MHLGPPPPPAPQNKNWLTTVFDFSWDDCNTQEKLERMVIQNLGRRGGGKQGTFWSIWNWWILRLRLRLGLSCVELHHGTLWGRNWTSFLRITSKWRIFPMCLLIYNHLYLCNSSLDLNIQPQLEPGVVLPWHDETFRSGLSRPEVLRHSDRKKDQRPWKSLKR